MIYRPLETSFADFISSRLRIIGLTLPSEAVDLVLADHPDIEGVGTAGFIIGLRRRRPLASCGVERGWEILGEEHDGSFHSWHCNNLAALVRVELGIAVNDHGLIDNHQPAMQATELVRLPPPPEPVD